MYDVWYEQQKNLIVILLIQRGGGTGPTIPRQRTDLVPCQFQQAYA
ncbi:hypothetical protein X953_00075 [Virgibacillus sp. SK37]|nr:hypothetical protein X953_00075 [Virgibacillus sp. SK37]